MFCKLWYGLGSAKYGPGLNPVYSLFLSIKFYWHLATPITDTLRYPGCFDNRVG